MILDQSDNLSEPQFLHVVSVYTPTMMGHSINSVTAAPTPLLEVVYRYQIKLMVGLNGLKDKAILSVISADLN